MPADLYPVSLGKRAKDMVSVKEAHLPECLCLNF